MSERFGSGRPDDVVEPCPAPGWLEIELHEHDGSPVAGHDYWVRLPDGEIRTGKLDGDGRARIEQIRKGTAIVRFPGTDMDDWDDDPVVLPARPRFVEIVVVDHDDVPVAGERVELRAGERVLVATSNAEGVARFDGLPPGTHTVRFLDRHDDDISRA